MALVQALFSGLGKSAASAARCEGNPSLLERAAGVEGGEMAHVNEPAGSRPLQSASTGELVGQLFRESSELLKKELELSRAEVRESVKAAVKVTAEMVAAAIFGLIGLGTLTAAAVIVLANSMSPAMAALIVGVVLLAIAGVAVMVAKSQMGKKPLERTQRTLKEDVQWAKEKVA